MRAAFRASRRLLGWCDRLRLGPILVAGVVVRVALVALGTGTDRFLFADSSSYLRVAGALPSVLWAPSGAIESLSLARPPAYPLLIALAGGPDRITLVVLVQCLVGGALTPWLVHRLADRVAGARAATVAALVAILDPASMGHHLLIASETLAAALVAAALLAVHAVVAAIDDDRSPLVPATAAGALLAALALTRPNLVVLAPAAVALVATGRWGRPRAGLAAAAVAVVALVLVGGWVVRNDQVAGRPVLSTVAGQNLHDFGLAASATEAGDIRTVATTQEEFDAALRAAAAREQMPPPIDGDTISVATDRRWSAEGLALMRDHPRGALVVAGRAAARTAVAPSTELIAAHLPPGVRSVVDRPLRVGGVLWLVGLWGFALAGAVALGRDGRRLDLALLAGTVVLVLATSVGPWMYARFRVPVVPALAVLAGIGATQLLERVGRPEPPQPVD